MANANGNDKRFPWVSENLEDWNCNTQRRKIIYEVEEMATKQEGRLKMIYTWLYPKIYQLNWIRKLKGIQEISTS